MIDRRMFSTALVVALAAGCPFAASAQDAKTFPTKPITLIVPFAPGGSTDLVARLAAEQMSGDLGKQVVVENHGGGGTVIGTDKVAKAAPDGYTMMLGSTTLAINPGLRNDLPYDTLKALQPLSMLSRIPYVLVASPKSGLKTVQDLVAKAKASPGSVNVASPGVGSGGHLASELFESQGGVDFTHVPYKGTGPAMTDLLGGQVDILFGTILSVMPHIESGALVPIAVTIRERVPAIPNVPTIAESGLPNYESSSWNGLLVPAGTPKPIVDKLNASIRKALAVDSVKAALAKDGAQPAPTSPDEFRSFLDNEIKKWSAVIKAANIKPE
jgi:tripartite-type tricarboxylate transporter receptor subunit TctC